MKVFLRLGAYLFHPLLMPFLGTVLYFIITPRYIDDEIVKAKLLAVIIITFLIPVVLYFLLKNIGWITTSELEDVAERKIPLMLQSILFLGITKLLFDPYQSPELYYFFVGVLFSSITALFLVIFKIKASLHQIGIAGVTMFVIAMSIHFQVNLLIWIGLLCIANGWVASSRLATNSHTMIELLLGFFIGVVPQLLLISYWL